MNYIHNLLNKHFTILGISWLLGISAIIIICYDPAWQTNDDPIFNMLINGYGLANNPADPILNCNYLWAAIIRLIPAWFGYSNYTLALYFFSILSVCVIWINIIQCQKSRVLPLFILTSMLFYNLLNPQYTVTAFYCTIAAITGIFNRVRTKKFSGILSGFILGITGFLIREMSFLMIAVLSFFIIPWRGVFKDKLLCIALYSAAIILIVIFFADYQHKSNFQDWDKINAWQNTRQFLADSDIVNAYKKEPELLKKFNLSQNDMNMLRTHFNLAPDLRDVSRIDSLKKASSLWLYIENKFHSAERSVGYLFSYPLYLLLFLCALLFVQRYSVANLLTFLLIFVVFFMIGFINRGGTAMDRIYYAPLYLFALLLLMQEPNSRLHAYVYIAPTLNKILLTSVLLFSVLAFSKMNLVEQWRYQSYDLQKTEELLDSAVWAGYPFLIEKIYYPFRKLSENENIKFQCGSWSALLPDSVSFYNIFNQDSFREFMLKGFKYAASQKQVNELGVYCREHFGGEWHAKLISPSDCFDIYEVKCDLSPVK